ncbi:MAG TPA: class I SAM-dependent methyltransferase [Acidimicrobiales bacterium]|nr:class I SAM-dependent methyltransferase [Acidimicrobiales bacterium]
MTETVTDRPVLDMGEVEQFMHQVIGDLGAALSAVLIHVGDRLGLYRAMGDAQPVTSVELAARTGLAERYVREWLHNQAAGGWVRYDPATRTFVLPAEHALLVADESQPTFLLGGFDFVASTWADEDVLTDAFTSGEGIGWHQHDHRLFQGTERFFRPGYQANLIDSWLPALDGVVERLERGARVADVGCGYGAATILMGEAFPRSTVVGFDYHEGSIVAARKRATEAGVDDRVRFETAGAKDFTGSYDLVCLFDCLHDMGDPVGAATHVREQLADDGTLLLVEPAAADRPEDNHHPLGRLMYAASTMICTPASLAQEVGLGLGNQVGFERLSKILAEAGFRHVRLAATTPVNLVIEARP